jgi:hypothetical protein
MIGNALFAIHARGTLSTTPSSNASLPIDRSPTFASRTASALNSPVKVRLLLFDIVEHSSRTIA